MATLITRITFTTSIAAATNTLYNIRLDGRLEISGDLPTPIFNSANPSTATALSSRAEDSDGSSPVGSGDLSIGVKVGIAIAVLVLVVLVAELLRRARALPEKPLSPHANGDERTLQDNGFFARMSKPGTVAIELGHGREAQELGHGREAQELPGLHGVSEAGQGRSVVRVEGTHELPS